VLIGRDPEQRLIEGLLKQACHGTSAALVVRGEPGIGKTALLEHAASSSGMRTLRCTGIESEHDVPFAALEQLLRPVMAGADRLPDPQAAALRGAFGLSGERVEDRLLLGLATLNLLAETTRDAPLVCLVDDLQWVDGPSAQALLFAARRLDAEGLVMLFAVRNDPGDWFETPGIAQLTLGPLSDPEARQVVATRGARLSRAAEQRLVGHAGGNPLALLELAAADSTSRYATGVEAAFRARIVGLSADTRRVLALASINDLPELATWTQLERLVDLPSAAIRPGVAAGLVSELDAIVFRHPLVRSAVYNASSRAQLVEAHRTLAFATTDPVSRASHLAAAAQEPDEALAAELDDAATAASRRGAFASAAALLSRAAELSTDADGRVRRLIATAQAHLDAGEADAASRLAGEAVAQATAPSDQAALGEVRGALEIQTGTLGAAYDLLVGAARVVALSDPAHALDLQAQALVAAFVAGWPERGFVEAHEFFKTLPPSGSPYEQFLRQFIRVMASGPDEPGATARENERQRLLAAVRAVPATEPFRVLTWAAFASSYLGDLRASREHSTRAVASARAAGSFNTLPLALLGPARLDVNGRAFDRAEEFAREGIELTRSLGQENLQTAFTGILVRCLAARGLVEECREMAETTLRGALSHGVSVAADDVRLGLAELELSLSHGAAARDLIEAVSHRLFKLGALPYLVEAMLLSGDPHPEEIDLGPLAAYAATAQDPHMSGLLARTRALTATSPEQAEPFFLEALSYQAQHGQSFERARTALAYGEFLRRAQRRAEARAQLRDALATFEGLNTPLWADRARAELEATGITARKRDPSTLDTLTPQELRIAKLVGGGASNRDVANQLFLSQKTVEYHLRKVFMKLGVSSRVELARQSLQAIAAAPAN
jgi:DNA-binding CsgD family transcriptional regulator